MSKERFSYECTSPTDVIVYGASEFEVRSKLNTMPGLLPTKETCTIIRNGIPYHGIKVKNTSGLSKLQIDHMLNR